jgi:tyrosinase
MNTYSIKLTKLLGKIIRMGCLSFLLSLLLFSSNQAYAQTPPRQQTYVRRDICTFMQSPQKMNALRKAIQVMKSRDNNLNDPTSWIYQANMHGNDFNNPGQKPAWDTCEHGHYFFLPWHRMYLHYFEKILRNASGDPTLALPYWNYSSSIADRRRLPRPFRSKNSVLYVQQRDSSINNGTPLNTTVVNPMMALGTNNYLSPPSPSFGGAQVTLPSHFNSVRGQLELQPHNQVHVAVGGASGWMSDPDRAARDPIFWLHHANIDRLWQKWLQDHPNFDVSTLPVNNAQFTFFDENGQQVTMSAQELLNKVKQMDYTYQSLVPVANTPCTLPLAPQQLNLSESMSFSEPISLELGSSTVTVSVPLEAGSELLRATSGEERLILEIQGIQYNPKSYIPYDIYIGLPEGVAPEPEGPYYAGKLALFAYPQGSTFSIEIPRGQSS